MEPSKWAKKFAKKGDDFVIYGGKVYVPLEALDAAAEEVIRTAYKFPYDENATEDSFVQRVLDKLGR